MFWRFGVKIFKQITCQQCQAHDRSGRCLGQRRDHALDPSMLRKSPPTGFFLNIITIHNDVVHYFLWCVIISGIYSRNITVYLALAYSSSKPCKFFMSECHTQPMHRIGPSSKSPATFAPSLSIRTPSPSHHRCLNSRQNPPQSLDCKFVKLKWN